MLRIDAEHRRAEASTIIEWNDEPVGILFHQPVDKMNLRAYRPLGARGRLSEAFDNVFRGARFVCKLYNLKAAFGVGNYTNSGITGSHLSDMQRKKPLMHGAMALPQDDPAAGQHFFRISPKLFVRIPNRHLFKAQAESISGISSKVLIGKEQDPITAF